MIEIKDNGTITYDSMVIGKIVDGKTNGSDCLIFDLGWMKAAGLGLVLRGDPEVDHKRGGIVLER